MTFYRVSRSFPSILRLLTVKAFAARVTKINVNNVVPWKNSPDGMFFHNGVIRKESTHCRWAKRGAAPPPEGLPELSWFTGQRWARLSELPVMFFVDFIRVTALTCGSSAQFEGTEVSCERRLWNETRQDVTSRWKCIRQEVGTKDKKTEHQRTEAEAVSLHFFPFFSGCLYAHVPLSQSVHLSIRLLLAELCHPFISSETKGRIH